MAKPKEESRGGRLFIISAPSGCGKTTLCNRLLNDNLGLANSISMTTRPPRPDERGGIDYHFVSKEQFRRMIKTGGFLEYEDNFGHLYGTPRRFVEDKLRRGRSVLLSIDVKGAMKVKKAYPKESVLIFILPPSIGALKRRLRLRRSDEPTQINTRLKIAKSEMSYKDRYGYRVVNDRIDNAYRRLKKIIVEETCKTYQ